MIVGNPSGGSASDQMVGARVDTFLDDLSVGAADFEGDVYAIAVQTEVQIEILGALRAQISFEQRESAAAGGFVVFDAESVAPHDRDETGVGRAVFDLQVSEFHLGVRHLDAYFQAGLAAFIHVVYRYRVYHED